MKGNLSYKQKLRLVVIGGLLAAVVAYRLSISTTIGEYLKYRQETSVDTAEAGNGASVAAFQTRTTRVMGLMNLYRLDTLRPEKNLLAAASNYCKFNELQLKEYKPYGLSRTDSLFVLTRVITVTGAFVPCLKFLYMLEKQRQLGRISSSEFKTYKDPQDKKLKLDCTVYIQNVITSDHEQQ